MTCVKAADPRMNIEEFSITCFKDVEAMFQNLAVSRSYYIRSRNGMAHTTPSPGPGSGPGSVVAPSSNRSSPALDYVVPLANVLKSLPELGESFPAPYIIRR